MSEDSNSLDQMLQNETYTKEQLQEHVHKAFSAGLEKASKKGNGDVSALREELLSSIKNEVSAALQNTLSESKRAHEEEAAKGRQQAELEQAFSNLEKIWNERLEKAPSELGDAIKGIDWNNEAVYTKMYIARREDAAEIAAYLSDNVSQLAALEESLIRNASNNRHGFCNKLIEDVAKKVKSLKESVKPSKESVNPIRNLQSSTVSRDSANKDERTHEDLLEALKRRASR